MQIKYQKRFLKNYKKRIIPNKRLDSQFKKRLNLFIRDPKNRALKDHKLKGEFSGYRAFSITGDVRLVYKLEGNFIRLYDIGSHNQVY